VTLLPLALLLSLGATAQGAPCEGERLTLVPFDTVAVARPEARQAEEAVRRALAKDASVCLEPRRETVERLLALGGRLAPTAGGLWCPIDGQAEAGATVAAFAAAAQRLGARLEQRAVRRLVREGDRVTAVELSDGARLPCEVAIVAAGAWSAPLLAPLGVTLPLQARALQMLLTEPGPAALEPVVGAWGQTLSLKQLGDGAYLIGGGWPAEIMDEAGNQWALRQESVAGNWAVAERVYPPLAELALARGWAGIEAFTPDDLPLIGPVPGHAGVLLAAGFSGHGFALAPAVGEILAALALGRPALEHLWTGLCVDRLVSA
jgi:sarcosine oxidase subunit beta